MARCTGGTTALVVGSTAPSAWAAMLRGLRLRGPCSDMRQFPAVIADSQAPGMPEGVIFATSVVANYIREMTGRIVARATARAAGC